GSPSCGRPQGSQVKGRKISEVIAAFEASGANAVIDSELTCGDRLLSNQRCPTGKMDAAPSDRSVVRPGRQAWFHEKTRRLESRRCRLKSLLHACRPDLMLSGSPTETLLAFQRLIQQSCKLFALALHSLLERAQILLEAIQTIRKVQARQHGNVTGIGVRG